MNPKSLAATFLFFALFAFAPALASADVGVEEVSRSWGAAGEKVTVMVGCGFCYPPCKGAPGHRRPSPCMLDTKAPPPVSFPLLLVPLDEAPKPHRCGPRALCSPQPRAVPRQPPFTYLGEARPPRGEGPADGSEVKSGPRYVLDFTIPDLPAGTYTYVVFCDSCVDGKRGSLIAEPHPGAAWRLQVTPSPSLLGALARLLGF